MREIVTILEATIPDYAVRRMEMRDVRYLCDRAQVRLRIIPIVPAGAAPPPMNGVRRLYISSYLPLTAQAFFGLHEWTHVLAGDADELVEVILDETRYPLEDRIADLVAAIGVTTPLERDLPAERMEDILRSIVPTDRRAWQRYRAPWVARTLTEMNWREASGAD